MLQIPTDQAAFVDRSQRPTTVWYSWLNEMAKQLRSSSAPFGLNVKSRDFSAKGDGSTDDTQAIQEAIDASPARGGNIYLPAGTYAVKNLHIGDGNSTTASSRWGISLIGEGAPVTTTDGDLIDGGNSTTRLKYIGTAGGSMLDINGPLNGWGLYNLGFDGQNSAGYCTRLLDAARGRGSNLTFRGATATNLRLYGAAPSISQGVSYNYFDNIWVAMTGGDSRGIEVDSIGGSFFNSFMKARIIMPGGGAGGTARYGVYLGYCDSIFFFDLSLATQNALNHSIVFDYTATGAWPNSCGFVATDNSGIPMLEINPPAGGLSPTVSNWFVGFSRGNGMVPPFFDSCVYMEGMSYRTRPIGVASLDASAKAGARAFVNTANSTTFNAAAAGGGTNEVPVFKTTSGGWKIG